MKVVNTNAKRDPNNGKNTILVELDEDDVILLGEIIRSYEQSGKFDQDDNKVRAKLNHNKEMMHKAFTLVRPS